MLLNALKSEAVFKVGAFGGDSEHLEVYPRLVASAVLSATRPAI